MKRTQIYLREDQHEFLEKLAFYLSQKKSGHMTMSELIRQGIDLLEEKYGYIRDETDLVLKSSFLMEGIEEARNEKELLDFDEVFEDS